RHEIGTVARVLAGLGTGPLDGLLGGQVLAGILDAAEQVAVRHALGVDDQEGGGGGAGGFGAAAGEGPGVRVGASGAAPAPPSRNKRTGTFKNDRHGPRRQAPFGPEGGAARSGGGKTAGRGALSSRSPSHARSPGARAPPGNPLPARLRLAA